jgi:hypothetical protein
MIVVRSLLMACFLGSFALTFTNLFAQQPRAVQLFTATEDISMFLRPGEMFMDKEGLIWFGSDNKLISFNGYHFASYPLPENLRPYTNNARVGFHYQDRAGRYWTFIHNNGLYQFDPSTATFKNIAFPANAAAVVDSNRLIGKFLFEDSHNRVWFCLSEKGLICISNNQLQFYPVKDADEYDPFVSATWINKGYETSSGIIYFGTNDGMIEFSPEGQMKIYKDKNSLSPPGCRCIINGMASSANADEIVTTTWGNGIKVFNTVTKQFTTITLEKPNTTCSNNVMTDLQRLTDSTYFIVKRDSAGQTGFCIYNNNTHQYQFLQGLEPVYAAREFNKISSDSNFIWVTNLNQVYRFYIPALKQATKLTQAVIPSDQSRPLHIYVDKLLVNDVPMPLTTDEIELKNWQNSLRFTFACKGASVQDSLLFSYRLKGYEKSWHSTHSTSLQYNNLPPGKYALEIKVDKSPYANSPEQFILPVNIQAQWWQSLWLRLGAAAVLILLAFYIYRLRVRRVKEEERLKASYEKKIAEIEMKALRAQMNPHFIFNCLNSINRYIVKSDHITASNYLTRFSKLIRHILDNSASGIIPLETEIETLDLYVQMEAMRFHDKFSYTITTDPAISSQQALIPSMLVQPYVENAIWHGLLHKKTGNPELRIAFTKIDQGLLQVLIEDNGIGRQMAAQLKSKESVKNKSQGLQITSDRLELIKNLYGIDANAEITDLYNDDGLPTGTRVTITLPLLINK